MRAAELLIVCDAPFGPGNVANLRLALEAARAGVETVVIERSPIEERDFTGGEASDLWRALGRISRVLSDYEELALDVR
jgi:iron complex transport system ATP-binding protein